MSRSSCDGPPGPEGRTDRPQRAPFLDRRGGHRLYAAIYDPLTAPLEKAVLGGHRSALIAGLSGLVLDLGAGTGANPRPFPQSAPGCGGRAGPLDAPTPGGQSRRLPVPVQVRGDAAEALGFEDATFDEVVCTCVLCSVQDVPAALSEVRGVLRPGGLLAVLEHVRADGGFAKWQRRLEPIWSRLNPGCHPHRDISSAIGDAGCVFFRRRPSTRCRPGCWPGPG